MGTIFEVEPWFGEALFVCGDSGLNRVAVPLEPRWGQTFAKAASRTHFLRKPTTGKVEDVEYSNQPTVTLPSGKLLEYVVDGSSRRVSQNGVTLPIQPA